MIVEVNDAGDILVPAELVQAAPHTRLEADREGDAVILRPLAERSARSSAAKTSMAPTAGNAVFVDTNILVYASFPGAPFHAAARARLNELDATGAGRALDRCGGCSFQALGVRRR
jgi:virulence-associated protein VagC